ncbi:MAG: gamma-glutamyl-gamma-aminobutyrate hydrolase family protein, partial [Planctomycetota bacterium]
MSQRLVIGLNMDYCPARQKAGEAFGYLSAGYFDCVIRADAIPVVVPPLVDTDDIDQILDRVDAFVMIGGADLDSRRDGYEVHTSMKLMDPRREDFDRVLMRRIAKRRIPVLAIGAGMQLLNITMGGSLSYHIPEDFPNAIPHFDRMDPYHRHSLIVEPKSMMGRVYGDGDIRVASRHHMAIYEVADGFRATATAPDGIVEAIEFEHPDWIAVGTQF